MGAFTSPPALPDTVVSLALPVTAAQSHRQSWVVCSRAQLDLMSFSNRQQHKLVSLQPETLCLIG